jgi:hypothetical protein
VRRQTAVAGANRPAVVVFDWPPRPGCDHGLEW